MQKRLIGAELEGYLTGADGELVDTLALLGGEYRDGYESLGCDVGFSSFEATSAPCDSAQKVGASLQRALAHLPSGVTPHFVPRTPYAGEMPIARKPRYAVMAKVLRDAHPSGYNGMLQVAPWNATHLHIGVDHVLSVDSVALLNLLNNIAPYARVQVIERFGIQHAHGHLNIWRDFTRSERLPAPRWFASAVQLEEFIGSIPMLFRKVGDEWHPGNGESSRLGVGAAEGVLWWLARPRATYSTIEWRPFPSMMPRLVQDLVHEVFVLADEFYGYVNRYPSLYASPNAPDTKGIYRHLSHRSWLVPREPLSNERWWQLFAQ